MPTGLILSGGGARAAYQVGVLRGISQLLPHHKQSPFEIVCGTSAGAINAAKIASESDNFKRSVRQLYALWSTLSSDQVHNVGFKELIISFTRLMASFFHKGIALRGSLSLLDNSPLRDLLTEHIKFTRLPGLIEQGLLQGLSITSLGYQSGQNISFYQAKEGVEPWQRAQRIGQPTWLTIDHIMASSALPTIFPPVRINDEFFGDGAIRQTAPMSAALHMGADKLLIIGVSGHKKNQQLERRRKPRSPTIAQIVGQLLNSAFIDTMEEDLDMLERFNGFIDHLTPEQKEIMGVKKVDVLTIQPSIAFDELAAEHIQDLPLSMRVFLSTIGATPKAGGSSLASYILFEAEYCKVLIDQGVKDVMEQADKIRDFFS